MLKAIIGSDTLFIYNTRATEFSFVEEKRSLIVETSAPSMYNFMNIRRRLYYISECFFNVFFK